MTTTRKTADHSRCQHEATKAARSACRRERVKETTATIVNHTFVFVRRARAEGCVNMIHRITLDEVAQEHGYRLADWNPALAVRLVHETARLMGEWEILADDMRP
jgi:hypothetical protein